MSVALGKTAHVDVTLDDRAFSIWSNGWTTVPGRHDILVGNSSRNTPLRRSVTVP